MKTLKIFLICIFYSNILNAQQLEIVNSGGGFFEKTEGSITFSIGEVLIETYTHGELCFTQGFCQANIKVTAVEEITGLEYELLAYPNPTKNFIILKIVRNKFSNLKYFLFDVNGKLLESKDIISTETNIPFHFLMPSVYFLKIIENQVVVKTFKIIKTK